MSTIRKADPKKFEAVKPAKRVTSKDRDAAKAAKGKPQG